MILQPRYVFVVREFFLTDPKNIYFGSDSLMKPNKKDGIEKMRSILAHFNKKDPYHFYTVADLNFLLQKSKNVLTEEEIQTQAEAEADAERVMDNEEIVLEVKKKSAESDSSSVDEKSEGKEKPKEEKEKKPKRKKGPKKWHVIIFLC